MAKSSKKLKVAIYARTSTDNLVDNDKSNKISVDLQIKECEALAKENNYEVVAVRTDKNLSSVTYPTCFKDIASKDLIFQSYMKQTTKKSDEYFRQGLSDIIELLPEIDILLIRNETRLFRCLLNSQLMSTINQAFQHHNVKVQTTEGKMINYNNFSDVFMQSIISMTLVQDMLEKIRNAKASIHEKQKEGELIGIPPLGYGSYGKGKIYEIPEEQKTVKLMFQKYLELKSQNAVAEWMTKNGYKKRNGNGFDFTTVCRIISNPVYTGYQYTSKAKVDTVKCKWQKKPLIDQKTFNQVQVIINQKKNWNKTTTTKIYPLSGILFCKYCQKQLVMWRDKEIQAVDENGKWKMGKKKTIEKYHCTTPARTQSVLSPKATEGCRKAKIHHDIHVVKPLITYQGLKQFVLPYLYHQILQEIEKGDYDDSTLIKLNLDLKELEKKEQKYMEMEINGDLDDNQFSNMMKMLSEKKKSVHNSIKKEQQKANENKHTDIDLIDIRKKLAYSLGLFLTSKGKKLLSDYEFKVLVNRTFKKINIAGYFIELVLVNGDVIKIDRMQFSVTRALPTHGCGINDEGKLEIRYCAKSNYLSEKALKGRRPDEENIIYESNKLKVIVYGFTPEQSSRKPISDYVINPDNYDLPEYLSTLK